MKPPAYDELPLSAHLGLPHAWEHFGSGDARGTLNFIDPAALARATACVRTGESISVVLPLDEPDPGMFWRERLDHQVFEVDRNTVDDRIDRMYLQGSTHWDGFRHVSAAADGFYGGLDPADPGIAEQLGVHRWRDGIVGRGVLVDVEEFAFPPSSDTADQEITVDDLRSALRAQQVELTRGSILCLRTGWTERFRSAPSADRERVASAGRFPGLRADRAMSAFLWDAGVAAIAADNPAVEVAPGERSTGSLHRQSLVMTGLPFGELFDFAQLAHHCRATRTWDFMFVSVPLNLRGGVGSPANAIAIT